MPQILELNVGRDLSRMERIRISWRNGTTDSFEEIWHGIYLGAFYSFVAYGVDPS